MRQRKRRLIKRKQLCEADAGSGADDVDQSGGNEVDLHQRLDLGFVGISDDIPSSASSARKENQSFTFISRELPICQVVPKSHDDFPVTPNLSDPVP